MELAIQINHAGTDLYHSDLETRTELMMQVIMKASDKSIPKRKLKTKQEPPWWTRELHQKRAVMRQAHRRFNTIEELRAQRRLEYNKARNDFVKLLRAEKKKSWRTFADDIKVNIWGKCFRWVKKGSTSHDAPSILKKPNGEFTRTLRETLQYLLDTLIPSDPNEAGQIQEPRKVARDYQETSIGEIKNAIWRMSTKKAPGEDGIDAAILRKAWNIISYPVTELFNDLLRHGYFPRIWRTADVVTILNGKEKPREDPKSFRPVSLLPVMGKAFVHLVCTRMNREIQNNLADNQHGFRKGRSTITAINEVKNWVANRQEKHVLGVFLDISGAFDNVRWVPLVEDMKKLGASQATISITKSYLVDRRATLEVNQTKVSTSLTRGCPQGSGFGLSLWNIAVNKVLKRKNGEHTHRVAYADDIVVLTAGETRTDIIQKTEEHLRDLIDWSRRYGLSFSPSKSSGVPLKGGLTPGYHLKFGDMKIKIEDKVKYLGIMIDKDMKYKSQIQNIIQKQIADFSRLRSTVGTYWGTNFNSAILLYWVFIPRITYASSIWMTNWGRTEISKIN